MRHRAEGPRRVLLSVLLLGYLVALLVAGTAGDVLAVALMGMALALRLAVLRRGWRSRTVTDA